MTFNQGLSALPLSPCVKSTMFLHTIKDTCQKLPHDIETEESNFKASIKLAMN